MKKLSLVFVLMANVILNHSSAFAAEPALVTTVHERKPLLIVEIQTESSLGGAKDEYIKLFNPNELAVDITNWQLQYRSATKKDTDTWTMRTVFGCAQTSQVETCSVNAPAKQTVLLATEEHQSNSPSYPLKSGMALPGGQVRLVQPGVQANTWISEDMVGYGTAASAEGEPATAAVAPGIDNPITRKTDDDGEYIDTNNNAADFTFLHNTNTTTANSGNDEPQPEPITYLPLRITELLPDPASPAEDETDEFIELYNPNDIAVTATNYVLQTGGDWQYKYTLAELSIAPHTYWSLRAEQTNLTLSNNGTGVRLLDPAGTLIDEVANYGKAKTGRSWMRSQDAWSWTLQLTPNAPNELVMEAPTLSPTKIATKTVAKTPSAKSSPKKATSKAAKPSVIQAAPPIEQVAEVPKPTNYWFIGSAAGLAGSYGLYEYRTDITTTFRRWRQKFNKK